MMISLLLPYLSFPKIFVPLPLRLFLLQEFMPRNDLMGTSRRGTDTLDFRSPPKVDNATSIVRKRHLLTFSPWPVVNLSSWTSHSYPTTHSSRLPPTIPLSYSSSTFLIHFPVLKKSYIQS